MLYGVARLRVGEIPESRFESCRPQSERSFMTEKEFDEIIDELIELCFEIESGEYYCD